MSFPHQQARTQRFTLGVPRTFQISPDGTRVTFLRGRDGLDKATCLWLHDTTNGDTEVIADPRALGADDENLPPEERARRERLREHGGGIVSYTVDSALDRAVFALSGRLFHVDLTDRSGRPRELPATGPVVDPRISPSGDRVAYVSGNGQSRAAVFPDFRNQPFGSFPAVSVIDGDGPSFLGKEPGGCCTNAPGGAGNQYGFHHNRSFREK